uniref:Sulfotransferase n=1 Tax=Vitis vinifera TaxID=29760 RepID=F6GTE6_VITVI
MTTVPSSQKLLVPGTNGGEEQEQEQQSHDRERSFERYREVISTLPKEKGWTTEHLYQYQGCWYRTTSGIQGVIWMQEHFKPRPADVLLVTPPKSGTTWFKALLFAIMNRTQFNTSTHPLLTTNSQCRIVYVSRNPKDVFAFEQYCKGFSPYGPFWDHILGYWKANSKWPERVLLLKYEDMKRDSSFHLKRIAEFIGQPFSSEEEKQGLVHEIIKLCSFESLSNMKVNKTGTFRAGYLTVDKNSFFRKGEVGDWKNHLTAEMAERLDKITERNLDGCDFSFDDSKDT